VKDHRYVEDLTLKELEEVLRLRRREERLKRIENRPAASDPLRDLPDEEYVRSEATRMAAATSGSDLKAKPRYSAAIQGGDKYGRGREKKTRRPIKWRWVWDRFLLVIELLALVGFLVVIADMLTTVRVINEESRAIQKKAIPTLTPTPAIGVYVLPGGHTPPDASKRSEPAPIPVHLRELVAEVTPLPVPTPGPEHGRRIEVPVIDVDAPIIEGDDWETLKKGVGHHLGSANPGERGNCVLSAHNDIYGEIFRRLPELSVGDEIRVHTETQVYRYVVEQTRIVDPTETSVLDQTSTPVLTLISCYPYGVDTHRIVVIASLKL
jgi:sortase A